MKPLKFLILCSLLTLQTHSWASDAEHFGPVVGRAVKAAAKAGIPLKEIVCQNKTKNVIVVQTAKLANGLLNRSKPVRLLPGEILREEHPEEEITVEVYDPRSPNKPVAQPKVDLKKANYIAVTKEKEETKVTSSTTVALVQNKTKDAIVVQLSRRGTGNGKLVESEPIRLLPGEYLQQEYPAVKTKVIILTPHPPAQKIAEKEFDFLTTNNIEVTTENNEMKISPTSK